MTNTNSEYTAIAVTSATAGPFGFRYIKDINSSIASLPSGAKMILLRDIDSKLNFNSDVTVDLNGKTISAPVTAVGCRVTITDSTRETGKCGGISGSMKGNFLIYAGRYSSDVSAWLADDHILDDGIVHSRFYTVDRSDGCLNIRMINNIFDTDSTLDNTIDNIASQAFEKIFLDHMADAAMSIDGKEIYSIGYDDVFGAFSGNNSGFFGSMLDGFNLDNLSGFISDIFGSVFDYKTLAEKISSGQPITEFEYTTKSWKMSAAVDGEGSNSRLAFSVASGDYNGGGKVRMFMQNSDDDSLAGLYRELGKLVTVSVQLNVGSFSCENKKISLDANAGISLSADFSEKPEYAVIMSLMLADRTEDALLKKSLVKAVTNFYVNDSTDDIKKIIDSLEISTVFGALRNNYTSSDISRMLTIFDLERVVGEGRSELQRVFDIMLSSVMQIFSKMDISGSNRPFSSLQVYGSYGLYYRNTTAKIQHYSEQGDISIGYSLDFESVKILAKFFDNKVSVVSSNGVDLYSGSDLSTALAAAKEGCTITVRKNLHLAGEHEIKYGITLLGVEKISFRTAMLTLTSKTASLTADAQIDWDIFRSGLDDYIMNESPAVSKYVYSLQVSPISGKFAVAVTDPNGDYVYTGSNAVAAFAAAGENEGSRIVVYEKTALTASVNVSVSVSIVGTKYIDFGKSGILLTSKDAELSTDKKLESGKAASGSPSYKLTETFAGNKYVYTLEAITPKLSVPTIDVSSTGSIRGAKVDVENKYIYIDAAPDGISTSYLVSVMHFTSTDATGTDVKITGNGKTVGENAVLCTGDELIASAFNESDKTDSAVYTLILIGDVNRNGRIDSGDALKMNLHYMGVRILTGVELAASDVNRNGRTDSGDAVKNSTKFTYMWTSGSYKSAFK